jgi:hypothetical protein
MKFSVFTASAPDTTPETAAKTLPLKAGTESSGRLPTKSTPRPPGSGPATRMSLFSSRTGSGSV